MSHLLKNIKVYSLIISLLLIVFGTSNAQLASVNAPPMGWNSWNWFGKNEINEKNMMECMDAMVESGLLDAGYKYFVIDGGWRDTKLGPNGELLAHPKKFPNGIKPLADYAHNKGLKFGLHTVPGTHDCGRDKVGGLGHEELQVKQFIDWGLDFIKLDKCLYYVEDNPNVPNNLESWEAGWKDENRLEEVYKNWSNLLQACGRDIVFNISAYKYRNWYPETCNMARTTQDIKCKANGGAVFANKGIGNTMKNSGFLTVMEIADINNGSADFAGSSYWNDPDMLAIGDQGLTIEEQEAHFALWCIMSAPLFLGNDPRNMTPEELTIITNKLAITINQDPTEQGRRIKKDDYHEVWRKNLKNGEMAVLLLNRNGTERQEVSISIKELGTKGKKDIHEVYSGVSFQVERDRISKTLEPHESLFLYVR